LVDRLLQVVEGKQKPDFMGGAIERVGLDEGYVESVRRADVVVLIGGAGGTWEFFRHALLANLPVIPLMSTGTDAERAGMLLLALGQNVNAQLIMTGFGNDSAAAISGRLIERVLADHDKEISRRSINNRDLVWMVDKILPLAGSYLRKKTNFEEEADQILGAFRSQVMPDSIYKQLVFTLTASSDRTWRITGYLAIQARASADYVKVLIDSQNLEEKEAFSNLETRPLWRWLVAMSQLAEDYPKEMSIVLVDQLQNLGRKLRPRTDVDPGGECKELLSTLISNIFENDRFSDKSKGAASKESKTTKSASKRSRSKKSK
jgi:hypothetical protein